MDTASNFLIDSEIVECTVKLHKAAGHDGIVSEHIRYTHPALLVIDRLRLAGIKFEASLNITRDGSTTHFLED